MKTVAAVVATLLGTASFAHAETLVFAHGFQPAHVVFAHGVEPWMECVAQKGEGRVTFTHFPGGQISTHPAAIDSLNSGVAQVSAVILSYVSEKMPLNGVTLLPDMGNSSVEMVTAYRKALDEGGPLLEEYHQNQLQPILVNLLPPYQFLSGVGVVDTVEKFRNLKASIGGGSQLMMAESMGTSPVYITAADMYVAMQRKTVDGTFLTLASAKPYSLTEVMNAVSANGSFGSGASVISMDKATYDGLAPESRELLDDCGREAEMALARHGDAENERLKTELAAMGIEVYEFSPETLTEISALMADVADHYVARIEQLGRPGSEALQSYRAALGR
ncbi:TRAP transporter substrate-binding protein [Paracoccus denitrificans]|jgi:TRAP-type C4-dicarboxylate transport system substrate-binding protein|uniref:TRAP dicarboxylate transporter-DctP subunit n=1 Tax=Paracoccus denitrificans (strain Pd 1222) TaxID=318586 RepID=A1B706_PARDP|nr:TRAP transporter substrate-binding protein DctP [Paracoccus denitrificans]ABL71300.1 TRAP dicarboxylate transporter- DctP subunit [Paracoccus denitrificans PD1222]MBB4629593.1 TRAP-type C4-dicarboxylate transport system substrate-binding protein [Paracoccus denitrificans]MCU7430989.1 TRAP transporter substrate-binding protein DctP [Paracoccus denitrificans]QAR27930.1 C4-dicarboxylate ABC transporter substrate-binding protein [Paracoccus denitrificans]UPV97644.1 TRAP transporter substrate-bi